MNTQVESRQHFGIPILTLDLPQFSKHQQALIQTFQKLRADDAPDMQRSNQGGWHSLDNLHTSKDPEIHWLTQSILNIAPLAIKQFEGDSFNGNVGLTNLWVNINGPGNLNMPHSHLPNEWSGVIYISVNDDTHSKTADRSGNIIFINLMPMGK